MGFDPWIDEDNLQAGDKLHRSILQGFKDSCAAIFFITPNFADEKYLATEIDYAVKEEHEKGNRFRIITLVMGNKAEVAVPKLLENYVYKHPQSKLEALKEIIKALPLTLDPPFFKE